MQSLAPGGFRVFILASAMLVAGCSERAPTRVNIILISIDTLRADHLGCYGYERDTSPNIDLLARDAVLFERASSHAPSTLPAHASIFTSLLPQQHGASHRFEKALGQEAETLAEVLAAAGYATASWNGGGQMSASFGVDQGFELYLSVDRKQDRFSRIVEHASHWLEARPQRPFFLFLHSFEVHQPFGADPEFVRRFVARELIGEDPQQVLQGIRMGTLEPTEERLSFLVAHYDAEVRSMDAALGGLLEALRARGLYDDSLIVLTSDHGEELGERGQMATHAHSLHEELLHIPLIVKLPRAQSAGSHIRDSVRGIDIAPTILAVGGLPAFQSFSGRQLLDAEGAWFAPDSDQAPATVSFRDTATAQPVAAISWKGWKLMGSRLFKQVTIQVSEGTSPRIMATWCSPYESNWDSK